MIVGTPTVHGNQAVVDLAFAGEGQVAAASGETTQFRLPTMGRTSLPAGMIDTFTQTLGTAGEFRVPQPFGLVAQYRAAQPPIVVTNASPTPTGNLPLTWTLDVGGDLLLASGLLVDTNSQRTEQRDLFLAGILAGVCASFAPVLLTGWVTALGPGRRLKRFDGSPHVRGNQDRAPLASSSREDDLDRPFHAATLASEAPIPLSDTERIPHDRSQERELEGLSTDSAVQAGPVEIAALKDAQAPGSMGPTPLRVWGSVRLIGLELGRSWLLKAILRWRQVLAAIDKKKAK